MRFFLILFIILFSCSNENNKEEIDEYQIISLVYQQIAKPIEVVFPPPPPDSLNNVFNSKDSARINSMLNKIKEKRKKKKFIVAVYPYLNSYKGGKHFMKGCSKFNTIMDKLIEIKDSLKVDINKIKTSRNDSIIYYKESLIIKGRKDYETFNVLISFSRIAFNKDHTKAVLTGSVSTSRLAGASMLFFLEKIEGQWKIKCEKGLSIS